MISATKRCILAEACGLEWLELTDEMDTLEALGKHRPSFSTPEDWELVRVNVVVPYLVAFKDYIQKICRFGFNYFIWFLTLSPEECCEIAADFILANLHLFPNEVQEKIKAIIEQEGE